MVVVKDEPEQEFAPETEPAFACRGDEIEPESESKRQRQRLLPASGRAPATYVKPTVGRASQSEMRPERSLSYFA